MFNDVTRRTFLQSSAALAISLPTLQSVIAAPLIGEAENTAHRGAAADTADADLLRAVGERIGRDAAAQVAPKGEAVSLMYFDYAGPSVSMLKAGIVSGLAQMSFVEPAYNEVSLPYGDQMGVAIVRNLVTAEEMRIEVNPTLLSHLAMIEEISPSAGIAKTSVLQADASYFYRATEYA